MCEIVYKYNKNELSEDVISYIQKKGVKVGTVREFLVYLNSKGTHFDCFIQLFNDETKTITCDFLGRFNKILPNFTYNLIFNKSKQRITSSKILHKRIQFVLSSDLDLLISNLQARNKHQEIQNLIEKIHEIYEYSSVRNVQPFFDALKKDVINHLLINNPESFIFPYLEQLQILVVRSYLKSEEIRLFGKTVMSASSIYIYNFLDSHELILNQRQNSTLFIEIFAHYFHSKEYTSDISTLIAEVPKLVRNIVLESYLTSKEIELFIHETSTYLKIMDRHQNYGKVEKILQLAHAYKMSTTNTDIGKLLWTMITDLFLICEFEDIDWLCTRFDNSITKNFFRKLTQHPKDRIYALANLLKFYYLFNPTSKYWKCKTNEEFYNWLLSQSLSEKLELMIDICGALSTKIQSTHLIGFFIYLALYQKRLYRILLGHCNVYRLQSLNRKTYLNDLYLSLFPLIQALRNIVVNLIIKANPLIKIDDELILDLLTTGWKLHFEDLVYDSLGKIQNYGLFEAYCKNIQQTIQNKDYSISKKNFRYDFYKVEFCEVKSTLEKIVKKLLGPIPIIPAKQPRSKSCHIQIPDKIECYYDSKDPFQKNRNVLHYKGYIVKEAAKYLAHSRFLSPQDLKKRHQYPIIYLNLYDILEDWRCQNVFINKYKHHYPAEIGYLSLYNDQNVEQFRLSNEILDDVINLLSIYCKLGFFPKALMIRPEIRNFLYTTLPTTKQTVAEWIQFQYDTIVKMDINETDAVDQTAEKLYKSVIEIKSKGTNETHSQYSKSDPIDQNQSLDPKTNLSEELEYICNDFYKYLINHKDALHKALTQIHQDNKYYPNRISNYTHHSVDADDHKSLRFDPWASLHDLIDSYKTDSG